MTQNHSQKYNLEKGWPGLFKLLNISSQNVLRHAQLPLDLLLRKSPTVTAVEYFRFWDGLAHVTQHKPPFALQLVQNIVAKPTDPAMIAFLSSRNLNVALERIAHYKPIIAPIHLAVEQTAQYTSVTFSAAPQNSSLPTILVAFELALWTQLARMAIHEPINLQAVHTCHDLPDLEAHEAFLGAAIQRDDFNRVTFSAADAQKPFLTVNHGMWEILEPVFDQRMEDLSQNAPFRDRVRACLVEILASGQHSMSYVASKLAISNRTLQRRLRQEGTTFQKVLDELREELARHYLSTSTYSSAEISFLLGYEEPNSFFRAFRAWTGQTPEVMRTSQY